MSKCIDKSSEIISALKGISTQLDDINLSSLDTAIAFERINVLEIKSLLAKIQLTCKVQLNFADKNFGSLLYEGLTYPPRITDVPLKELADL